MDDIVKWPSFGNLLTWAAGVSAPIIVALMGFKVIPREDIWIWLAGVVGLAAIGYLVRILEWVASKRRCEEPKRKRDIVEKAVHHKWSKAHGTLCSTMLVSGTDFREFCMADFSDAWLVQDPPNFSVTNELKRQIVKVSHNLQHADKNGHQKVLMIVLAWKALNASTKLAMASSLESLKESSNLSPKISFAVWDKSDLKV